ncbi:hypothetical protein [Paenibacillus sp. CF384]|uniref:hypothetical protein n=1 Tax=Paenibacillus sp. CF384 TaxID=1884382 RepID=UPI0008972470|nr:hypothetical protein [Paenibacillus sp. CF384]SDW98030.1 hypothetical protein SAMN05518855_1007148 [Paenibacillus sp. CF384]
MAFRNLFRKELKSVWPLYGVFSVAVFLMDLLLWFKSGVWEDDVLSMLSLLFPYIFIAVVTIGVGYYQLHSEWRTNSIYLLLSLPVRGWKVLAAKLAATITLLVGVMLWIAASFSFTLLIAKWEEWGIVRDLLSFKPELVNLLLHSFWLYLFITVFAVVIVQFAFLCGQLVARLKWLVVLIAFVTALWATLRVSPLLSALLSWTPDIWIGGEGQDGTFVQTGPFIVVALIIVGLTWLNGYMFEREVEV